jgi:hypothetical protein
MKNKAGLCLIYLAKQSESVAKQLEDLAKYPESVAK